MNVKGKYLLPLAAILLPTVLSACGGSQQANSALPTSRTTGTMAQATSTTGSAGAANLYGAVPQAQARAQQVVPAAGQEGTDSTVAPPMEALPANPFIATSEDRLSTFAMDVDTGSYTAARNYINTGMLPPAHTVRVEEFVNYFDYSYPPPQVDVFGIYVDSAPSPFGQGTNQIVRVGIQGQHIEASNRKDAVLTFVIDVSGSMQEPNRLPLVKQALGLLVDELNQADRIGIVVYGSEARVLLEHTTVANKETILSAIDSLGDEGSTNAEAGLRLGYDLASKHFVPGAINRVILCSDGVANVGETGPEGIRKKIRDYTAQGVDLTTIGFGMGDYNDQLMEQLADDGNGNYAYVDSLGEAKRIFVENLTGTLQVIAKDAKIQVDFNPAVVASYRLIGYENRAVADQDFRNDTVDAGEVGAGHSVTALYEVELAPASVEGVALTVQVRYADAKDGQVREISKPFERREFGSSLDDADPHLQLAVAVAGFAEQLRSAPGQSAQSDIRGQVLSLAQRAAGALSQDADVQELAQLVARASNLK
ncbi:MAG: VWA domain-containing protein [Chloroflexota bacterium]|nr:VWA domain-containing protein [Chloroflexota bacterium]MDQ5866184.1 VWA domain-containing protein [Chloroflexota bacterium]